jgi:hypothetical protein
MSGNDFQERNDLTRDNYAALDFNRWLKPNSTYHYAGKLADWKSATPAVLNGNEPSTQTAAQSYELVLAHSGASLRRDAVDERVIENVRRRRGVLIDSQSQVGGWPALESTPAPADSDSDGMPDLWERAHDLNPGDPSDRNSDRDLDGYTALEDYLNSLVAITPGAK